MNFKIKEKEKNQSLKINFKIKEKIRQYAKNFKIRQKKLKHRKYVIQELLSTEELYIKSLNVIANVIMKPSLSEKIINQDESIILFRNIESIYLFHKQLLEEFKAIFELFDNKSTLIGKLFLKMMPYFKLYFEYCNNYQESSALIDKMRSQNHAFSFWISKLEFIPTLQNLDFNSQMIKPIQRLPKYVLLFKDLKKNTENSHPDYQNIETCLKKFEEINMQNNSKMNDYLKKIKLFELEEKFGKRHNLSILTASRDFLLEEVLSIL